MIVQAISGGMGMTGEPGRSAVRSGIPLGDLSAGMYAVIGALAALEERRSSGLGQYIDISMLDCRVSMLCCKPPIIFIPAIQAVRVGVMTRSLPTRFNCANGTSLVITANTGVCGGRDVLEIVDLKKDARFIQ